VEEILGTIVVVVFILIRIFGRLIMQRRQEQQGESRRQAPRQPGGAPGGPMRPEQPRRPAEQDPFEELRRRIEEAARRRQEEEARRRRETAPPASQPQRPAEPMPAPAGETARTFPEPVARRQPIPPPLPQQFPQPQVRRQQRRAPRPAQPAPAAIVQPELQPSAPLEHAHIAPPRKKEPTSWERIESLPRLKKAIVMAEILGPPRGM